MKKLSLALSLLALVVSASVARAQASHEYSPLVEKTVNYKNWKLPNITSTKDVDLRSLIAGKKLVMIVYFAPWCGNWRNEAPIAAKLYDKYKAQGFKVIGVSEYANTADTATFFGEKDPPYPVVSAAISRDDKLQNLHYEYRQRPGETR